MAYYDYPGNHECLSIDERLCLLENCRKETGEDIPMDFYLGPQRRSNEETNDEIDARWQISRRMHLDRLDVPRLRVECSEAQLAILSNPDRKIRNSYLTGAWYGPLPEEPTKEFIPNSALENLSNQPSAEPASGNAPTDPNLLSNKERIDLAILCFGLYSLGSGPEWNPGDTWSYSECYRYWEEEVQVHLDGIKVPRKRDELTPEHIERLDDLKQRRASAKVGDRYVDIVDYPVLFQQARNVGKSQPFSPEMMTRLKELAVKFTIPKYVWGGKRKAPADSALDDLFIVHTPDNANAERTLQFLKKRSSEPDRRFVIKDAPFIIDDYQAPSLTEIGGYANTPGVDPVGYPRVSLPNPSLMASSGAMVQEKYPPDQPLTFA